MDLLHFISVKITGTIRTVTPSKGFMNKTKKKIILTAIEMFNKQGLANARNSDIAKEAGISLSNFNYHFHTKKDLVLAVITYLREVLNEEVYGQNTLLTKDGQGLEIGKSYFEFEERFKFFYLNTHNILESYPELKDQLRKQIDEAIQIIKNLNFLAVGKGFMIAPPVDFPGLYDSLARQIWINNHFWFSQANITGMEGDIVKKGLEANYAICYPYLTEKGKVMWQNFLASIEEQS